MYGGKCTQQGQVEDKDCPVVQCPSAFQPTPSSAELFFQKYKLYIIISVVLLILLIGLAFVMLKNK